MQEFKFLFSPFDGHNSIDHYENTPIHIYWTLVHQKKKKKKKKKENYQKKNLIFFHISAYIVGTC